jgi:enoyl-CoA hydratase/carnithine racemase
MSDAVLYAQDGHVVTLTMNRPDVRNAIGGIDEIDHFVSLLNKASADRSVRAVILTGAGSAFAAGGNVKAMREKTGMFGGGAAAIRENYRRTVQHLAKALWSVEVPTIAAVNGAAVGQGCDLACLCDMRLAGRSAKFSVPFLKLGIIPGDGGAWLFPRVVGRSRAAEMFYTGDMIDAETAAQWGLASRVVEDAALMDEAMALAQRIASNPPDVLRMTKRLLRDSEGASFETIMDLSSAMQSLCHQTEDHVEAIDAFFEKRPGDYKGR